MKTNAVFRALFIMALCCAGLLAMASCAIGTDTEYVKIKITAAYLYGNRLDVEASDDLYHGAATPAQAPGMVQALTLGTFHVTGAGGDDRQFVLDGAPAPGGPATLTLTINTSVDLGQHYEPGGFAGEAGVHNNTITYYSFAPDQPTTLMVLSPMFVVIPHRGTTSVSLIGRDLQGNQAFAYTDSDFDRVAHTTASGSDVYSISMEGFWAVPDLPVYLKSGAPPSGSSDDRPYLTSAGTSTNVPTPYENGVNYSSGTVLTIDNCLFAVGYSFGTKASDYTVEY